MRVVKIGAFTNKYRQHSKASLKYNVKRCDDREKERCREMQSPFYVLRAREWGGRRVGRQMKTYEIIFSNNNNNNNNKNNNKTSLF